MADFALDENRDADYDNESKIFNTITDPIEDLTQAILVFLNTNIGELPWNEDFGIDHQQVLMDIDNQSALDEELSDWIKDEFDDYVEDVDVTDVIHDGRRAIIQISIEILDGTTININQEVEDDGSD